MNVLFEGHNIDVLPEWKRQVEERLAELSDPRDPVIKARCAVSYKATEIPPVESSLIVTLRGRQIVITKRGDHIDGALKLMMDTAKREIRKFYEQRSNHRPRGLEEVALEGVEPGVREAAVEDVFSEDHFDDEDLQA